VTKVVLGRLSDFSYEVIYGERGVLRLERALTVAPCASR
jgi:hypothetical protein